MTEPTSSHKSRHSVSPVAIAAVIGGLVVLIVVFAVWRPGATKAHEDPEGARASGQEQSAERRDQPTHEGPTDATPPGPDRAEPPAAKPTPGQLLKALRDGDREGVQTIIKARPDLLNGNRGVRPFFLPLHEAVRRGDLEMVQLLLQHGANIDEQDTLGVTALMVSVAGTHLRQVTYNEKVIRLLLEKGANPNAKDNRGRTPLVYTFSAERQEVIALLLKNGAKVDKEARIRGKRLSILQTAVADKAFDIGTIRLLLKNKADSNPKTRWSYGRSLGLAFSNGRLDVVRLLISEGADLDASIGPAPGYREYSSARSKKDRELTEKLKAEAADLIAIQSIHMAVLLDDRDLVEFLISKGADPDAPTSDFAKCRPLHLAAIRGRMEMARFLLEKGASLESRDRSRRTPLHQAVYFDRKEVAALLIEKGASVRSRTQRHRMPLHLAAERASPALVRLLLEKDAEAYVRDYARVTPLHLAAAGGRSKVVELLLEKGAKVDARDRDKETPLMKAVQDGHIETVRLLLQKGADASLPNKRGRRPVDVAVEAGHGDIAELLRKHSKS